MLSKPSHFSVCLCTGKCHRSHTSMERLMLILMIVLAISDSISSRIDPTASMHFKEPEKVSYNHSVTLNRTFENIMPSLTYELLDSTTTSPLSIHGTVVETPHDSSSFIRTTSSQTTKQSMFLMQSEEIMSTETPEFTETFKLERPNPFKLSSKKVGNHVPIFTDIDQLSSFTQLPYSKVLEAQDLQSNLQTSSGTETVSATGIFSIVKPPVTSSSVAYFYLDVQSLSSSISKNLSTGRLQLQSTASRTNTEAQTLADLPTSPSTAAVFRTKTDTAAIFATKISGLLIKKTTTSLLPLETATETILPDKISNTKFLTTNTIKTPLPAKKAITEAILPTNTVTFEQLSTKTSAIVASSAAMTTVEVILPTKIITAAELSTKTPSTVTPAAKTTVEAILPVKTVTAAVLSSKTSSTVTSAAKTTVEAILPTKIITAAVLSTKTSSNVTLPATKTTTEAILPTKTVTAAVLSTKPSSNVTLSATKTTTEAILPTKTATAALLSTKTSSTLTLSTTKTTVEAILPTKTVTAAVLSTKPSSTLTLSTTKTTVEAILPTKTVTAAVLSTKPSSAVTLPTTKTTTEAILPTKTVTAAVLSTKPSSTVTSSATKTTTEAILPTKTVTAAVLSTKPSSTLTLSATKTTNKAILPTKTVTVAVLSTKPSSTVTLSATKTTTEAILPTRTATAAVLSTKTSSTLTLSTTKTTNKAILPTKTVTAAVLSTKLSSTVTLSATKTTTEAILPTKTATAAVLSTKPSSTVTLSATKTTTEAILPTKTVTAAVLSTKTSSTLTLSASKTTNKAILPAKTVTAAVLSTKPSSTVTLSATKTISEAILPTKTVSAAVISAKTLSVVTLPGTKTTSEQKLFQKPATAEVKSINQTATVTLSATKTTSEAKLHTQIVSAAEFSIKPSPIVTYPVTKTTTEAIMPASTVTTAVLSTKMLSVVTLSATKTTSEAILSSITVTTEVLSTNTPSVVTLIATKTTSGTMLSAKSVTTTLLSTKTLSVVTLPATKTTSEANLYTKTATAAVLSIKQSATVKLATKTTSNANLPKKSVSAAVISTKTPTIVKLSASKKTYDEIQPAQTVYAAVLPTKTPFVVKLSATKTIEAILPTKTVIAAVLSIKPLSSVSATKTTTEAILPAKTVNAAVLLTKKSFVVTLSATKSTSEAILPTKTVTAAVLSTKTLSVVTLTATKTTPEAKLPAKTAIATVLSTKTSSTVTLPATWKSADAILPTKTVSATVLIINKSTTSLLVTKALLPSGTASKSVLPTKTSNAAMIPTKTLSKTLLSTKILTATVLPQNKPTSGTRRITSSIFEHFSNYFPSFSTSTFATDAQWWQTERQFMFQEKLPTPSSIRLLNLQQQSSTNTMMLETLQLSPSTTKPLQTDGKIVLFVSLLNMPKLKSESSCRNTESPVWQPTLIKMSASIQPMTYSPEETFSTAQTLSTVTTLLPSSEVTFSNHIQPSSMQQLTTEKSRQPLSYKEILLKGTKQRDLDLQSIPLARTMFTDMKEIATSFDEHIDSSNTLSAELSNLIPSDVALEVSEQLTRYLLSSVMTYEAAAKQSSTYREVIPGYQTTELELETDLSGLVYSSSSAIELTVPEPKILLTPPLLAHFSKILDQPSSFMDITDYETIRLRQTSSVEPLTGTNKLKSIINSQLSTPSKSSTRATVLDSSQNISSYTMSVITQQKRMTSLSAWSVLIERTKLSSDPGVSISAGTQFTGSAGILTQSTDVLQLSTSFTTNGVSELQRQPKTTAKSVLLNIPHLISPSSSYINHIDSNSFSASIGVAVLSLFTDLSMLGSYAVSSSNSIDVLKDSFQKTVSSLTKSVDSEQDRLLPKPSRTLNSISSAPRLSPPRKDKVSQSEGSHTKSVGTLLTEEPHVSPFTVSKPLTQFREHTGSLLTTVQVSPVSFASMHSELQNQNQVHVSLGTTLLGTPQLLSPYAVPTLKGSYTETLIKGISQLSPSVTMPIAQGLETLSAKPLEPLSIGTRFKITPHLLSKFAVIIFSELQSLSYTVTSGTTWSPTSTITPLLSEQDEKGIFPAYIDGVVSSSLNKQLFSELGSISPASTGKYLTDIVQFASLPLSRIEEDNAYPRSTPSIHKPHISTPSIHLKSSEPNYLSVAFTELLSDNSHIGPTFTSVDYTVSKENVLHSTSTTTFLTSTILSSSFSEPDGAFLSSIITDLTDSEVDSYSITELTLLEPEITSPSTSDLIHNDIRNVAPLITKNRVSDSSWPVYFSHLSPSFTEIEVLKSDISFSNTASKFNAMLLLSPLKFEEPKRFSTTDAASMLKLVSKTSQPVTEYTGLETGVAPLAETVAMSTQLSRLIQSFIEFSVSGTKGIFSTASASVLTAMPNPSLSFTDLAVPKPESASSVAIEQSTPYIKRFTISLNDKMSSQLKYRSTTPISTMSSNVEHLSLITKRMILESDSILLSSTVTSKTEKPTLSASFSESNIFASKSATSATVASMITERQKFSTFTFKQSEIISSPATSFMLGAVPNFSTFSQLSVLEPESSYKTIASLLAVTPTLSLFKFNEPQSTPLAAAESVLLDPLKLTSSFSELTVTKSISSSATTVLPKQPSFEVMESETVFPAAVASMFKGIPKLASSFPDLTAFKTDVVFLSTITSKLRDILKTKEPVIDSIDSQGETSSTGLIDAVLTHINQLSSYTSLTISDSNRLFLTTTGKSIRDISMLSVPTPQLSSSFPEFTVLEPEHSFSTATLSLSTDIISPVTDLTIKDRKSSFSASTAWKSIGIPIATPSFSEFSVLKPGNSSSVATSILAYMPELLSSIIDFSNLEQESISPAGTTLAVTNQPKNFISFDRVKALEQDSLTATAFLTDISQSSSFTNLTDKESRVSTPAASASLLNDIPKLSSTFTEFMTLVLESSSLDPSAPVTSDVQNFSSTLGEFTVFESESSSRDVTTVPSGIQKLSSSFSTLRVTELDYLAPDATASYNMFTSIQKLSSLLKEFVIKESNASVPTFTNTPILSSSFSEFLVLKPVLVPKTSTSVPHDIRKLAVSFTEKVLSYKETPSLEKSSDNIIVTEMPLQETVKETRTLLPYTTSFEVSTSFDMEMQALDTSSLSIGKTPVETSPTSSSIKVAPISPMDHMPKETLSFLLPKTVEAAALLSLRPESLPTDVFTLKAADTLKSSEVVLLLESVSQPSSITEIEITETPELLPGVISEGLKDQLSTIMNNRISENHYSLLISSEATFDELTQSSSSTRNLISGTSSGHLLQTRHEVTLSSSYFDHFSVSKLDLSLFSKHTGNTNSTPTIVVHELPVSVLKEEALPVSKEDITLRYLSMVNASDLVMSIVSTTPAVMPTINSQFVSMLSKENQRFSISTEWLHPSSLSRLYKQRVSGATDILPSSTLSTIDTLSFLVPAVFLASVSKRHFSTTVTLAAPASDISTKETISSILESNGISSLGRYTTLVKLLPTRTEAVLSISSSKSDIGQATLSLSSELIATFIQFKTDILSSVASSFTSSSSIQSSFVGPQYAALNTVALSQVTTLVTTSVTSLPSLQYSMTEEPNNASLKVFGKERSLLFLTVSARQSTKEKLKSEILHTPAAVDLSLLSSGIRPTRVSSFSETTAILPSRKKISFPLTSMKTKYLSSLQQTPFLSLRWDETTKSEMNSLFRKVHASTSVGSSSTDEMVSPISIPDTSAFVSADFFSSSSVVTPGGTSIYTTRTKSPPYKIDIVTSLTIVILVKTETDIRSKKFELNIKAGLRRCYAEGIAKYSETDQRRERAVSNVTIMVTDMERNSQRPTHVDVEFYVQLDGISQLAIQVLATFSKLSVAETSAYLSYPVIVPIKSVSNTATQKPTDRDEANVPSMTYAMIGVPSISAVIAAVVLIVWYCQKGDHRLKQHGSRLADADLKIDIEKGEVVSASVSRNENIYRFAFDKGVGTLNRNLKQVEKVMNKTYGYQEGCMALKRSESAMNSASQRLEWLRKLGFRGSEIRKHGIESIDACDDNSECAQRCNIFTDHCVINDLNKPTDSRIDLSQTEFKHDSFKEDDVALLQKQNDIQIHTFRDADVSPSINKETSQLGLNIKPRRHGSISNKRKLIKRLSYNSSDSDMEIGDSKSIHSIRLKRRSENRKKRKLKQGGKSKAVQNTSGKRNRIYNLEQGEVQSLKPRVPSIPTEGHCCKIIREPLYTSLTLGKDNNFEEGDLEDEVFLADNVQYTDLSSKEDRTFGKCISDAKKVSSDLTNRQVRQKQTKSSYVNHCDIIRSCDSNNYSFLQDELNQKDTGRDMVQISCDSIKYMLDSYLEHWLDDPSYWKTCCDNLTDGSEYAGHEFESLNFTKEYTNSERNQRCGPHPVEDTTQHSNMADGLIEYRNGPGVCEHVTKMGRFSKNHGALYPKKDFGPQFRKLPFQEQSFPSTKSSTPEPPPSPKQKDSDLRQLRFIIPKKEIMKEIGTQTVELVPDFNETLNKRDNKPYKKDRDTKFNISESMDVHMGGGAYGKKSYTERAHVLENGINGIRTRDTNINVVKFPSKRENGAHAIDIDHTVAQDHEVSKLEQTTGKRTDAERELRFNNETGKRSASQNMEKRPLKKKISLFDIYTSSQKLSAVSNDKSIAEASTVTRKKTISGRESHLDDDLERKDTFDDKEILPERKKNGSQYRNGVDMEVNRVPKYEEVAKIENVTGKKTAYEREKLSKNEPGREASPQEWETEPQQKEDTPQDTDTFSQEVDEITHYEDISKVEHTTGGKTTFERGYAPENGPGSGDRPLGNEKMRPKSRKHSSRKQPPDTSLEELQDIVGKLEPILPNEPVRTNQRHVLSSPYVEMKLGRNMRAAPKGSIAPRKPTPDLDQQLLDATEPLLHNQSLPSNNIAEYYANTQPALPQLKSQGAAIASRLYPARSMTCPQHPSQHLIETLNRNSQTSLTNKSHLEDEQRKEREEEFEKYKKDLEARERHEQNFDTDNTLKEPFVLENEPNMKPSTDIMSPPPPPLVDLYSSYKKQENYFVEPKPSDIVSTQPFSPQNSTTFNQGGESSATTSSLQETDTHSEFRVNMKQETVEEVEEDIVEDIDVEEEEEDDGEIKDEDFNF